MFAAKTVMLFGGIWLLLAFIILPAHASTGTVTLRSIDTFPLLDNPISVQQVQLTWRCSKEEIGMQATIDYPSSLPAIMGSFHASAASVPLITPDSDVDQASAVRKHWKVILRMSEGLLK
jgi:hypothetical protein